MAIRIKNVPGWIKKNPGIPISIASLGVASANYATNRGRHLRDKEYQEKQLQAMDKLTTNIGMLNEAVNRNTSTLGNNQLARSMNNRNEKRGLFPRFRFRTT